MTAAFSNGEADATAHAACGPSNALVLLLLGLGVRLLLALLGATQQAHQHIHLGVVSDAAGAQAGLLLQLPASKHHALLGGGDACSNR